MDAEAAHPRLEQTCLRQGGSGAICKKWLWFSKVSS